MNHELNQLRRAHREQFASITRKSGMFCDVYLHDGLNYVTKYGYGDMTKSSSLKWIQYAQAAAHSPHVPKILELQIEQNFFCAKVELLQEIDEHFSWQPEHFSFLLELSRTKRVPDEIILKAAGIADIKDKEQHFNALFNPDDPLVKTLKDAKSLAEGPIWFDILFTHYGKLINVMLRGDQLVINDPLG